MMTFSFLNISGPTAVRADPLENKVKIMKIRESAPLPSQSEEAFCAASVEDTRQKYQDKR